jgi:peptide-methionine (S)-S-oxide reductase
MSIIFYHNDEQRKLAMESKERIESELGVTIATEIVPFSEFYLAEDYHQKYYLRGESSLAREYLAIYPNIEGFISSTAVARVNGYAGGYGTQETLQQHLDELGLSEKGKKRLLELASRGLIPGGCAVPEPS